MVLARLLAGLVVLASTANGFCDSAAEICSAIRASQERIERLLIEGYSTSKDKQNGSMTDVFFKAISQDRCFIDYIHQVGSLDMRSLRWLDPSRNETWWLPGRSVNLRVFERNAFSYPADYAETFRFAFYDQYIAWRPVSERKSIRHLRGNRRFYLIDIFAPEIQSSLIIQPQLETYDCFPCYVVIVDGGRDRLWICPKYGYNLVRRLWRVTGKDERVIEYNCRDFTEVEKDIWLPKNCTLAVQTKSEASFDLRITLEINRLAVNRAVPDSLFQPRFPPGTHVYGKAGSLESSIPGGTDLIDLWTAVAATLFPPTAPPYSITEADLIRLISGFLVLLLGAFLLMRKSLSIFKSPQTVCSV